MLRLRNKESGFGLSELLISLLVGSIVLLALHRMIITTTRSSVVEIKMGSVSRRAATLRTHVENALRNLGHNPKLISYPTCTGSPATDPDCANAPIRIGIMKPESAGVEFNSDEDASGTVEVLEEKAFWLADAVNPTHVSFQDLVEPAQPICIPKTGITFTTPYRLYEKSGASTTVLADNILCLEIRYYRYARPDEATTDKWVRVCPSGLSCPTGTDVLPDVGADEKGYYTSVRDIRRMEVGMILAGTEGKVEHLSFEFLMANPPWLASPFAGRI